MESFFTGRQAQMWTALPGIVKKFDADELTCEVQPSIQGKQILEDGSVIAVDLPLLLDCPTVFPHAGGCSITFPVKEGDECLVVFSSRAIDLWWQSGGVQAPAETRMHDLSDGFVILGPWSQPERIGSVSTECLEIRSDDREAFLSIHPTTHDVTLTTSGNVTETVKGTVSATVSGSVSIKAPSVLIDAPNVRMTGVLTVDGQIFGKGGLAVSGGSGAYVDGSLTTTGDVTAGSVSLQGHVHSGVQGGHSNTGGAAVMKVRRLTDDGDMTIGHSYADFHVDTADGVAQNVKTRLSLWKGQWFINTTEGTPWIQSILGKSEAADVVIRARILGTPGVREIINFQTIYDPNSRKLTVSADLDTIYGQTTIKKEMK